MKLTYRGHGYEALAPVQLDANSTGESKIKLIYRGHIYEYIPNIRSRKAISTSASTIILIYRGSTYERKCLPSRLHQKSSVINWRYRTSEGS